ncbi:hypothetical protein V5O48_015000 [Marasmius crinis-equi]|uniref:Ubiquitin-like protein ATG12 n=1 Tax=Marasmius crinis-equi TaxID=585013 RepID=A0ABR3EVS6_9AGAR
MAHADEVTPDRSVPSWAMQATSETAEEALKALQVYKKKDAEKVIVRFKAVGNAPIMKDNFFKITASNRFQAVIQFLRKQLGYKGSEPLHTYINLAFSPAPDDLVSNLFKEPPTDLEEVSQRLKVALVKYLAVLRDNRAHVHGHSVYTGIPGLIVMRRTLSSFPSIRSAVQASASDHSYDTGPLSEEKLQRLSESSNVPAKFSFLETPVGLYALTISQIDDEGFSDDPRLSFCADQLQNVIDSISRHENNSDDGAEVLYGRAGFLYELLFLRKIVHSQGWVEKGRSAGKGAVALEKILHVVSERSLSIVIESIIQRGRLGAAVYASEVAPSRNHKPNASTPFLMWSWHGKRYLGAAHGVVGILHVLLLCPVTLIQSYLLEIIQTIEWLISRQDAEGNWPTKAPNRYPVPDDPTAAGDERNELVQWCHGATGSLLLLSRTLQVSTNNPETIRISPTTQTRLISSLRAGASLVYRHGLLRKGIGLCHGIAGSIYALLAAADAIALVPEDGNKRNAGYYFGRAVHLAELATDFEALTKDGKMNVPDRPLSLFEGLAGMCCAWGEVCDRVEGASSRSEKWYRPRSGMPGFDDL